MLVIRCVVLDKLSGTRERILKVNSNTVEEAIRRISNYYNLVSFEVLKNLPLELLMREDV